MVQRFGWVKVKIYLQTLNFFLINDKNWNINVKNISIYCVAKSSGNLKIKVECIGQFCLIAMKAFKCSLFAVCHLLSHNVNHLFHFILHFWATLISRNAWMVVVGVQEMLTFLISIYEIKNVSCISPYACVEMLVVMKWTKEKC